MYVRGAAIVLRPWLCVWLCVHPLRDFVRACMGLCGAVSANQSLFQCAVGLGCCGSHHACLSHVFLRHAACAISNSTAAVTADGELYTWGCARDGRLGHLVGVDAPNEVRDAFPYVRPCCSVCVCGLLPHAYTSTMHWPGAPPSRAVNCTPNTLADAQRCLVSSHPAYACCR